MTDLAQGRAISHKIHPSPLKLALLAAYLGGHPSLMINDILPTLEGSGASSASTAEPGE